MLVEKIRDLVSSLARWSSLSANRKIFRAMLTIGAATVTLRALGMFKEMVIARYFGVGIDVDAFMIAMILPTVALNSVVQSFPNAMMPIYIQQRSEFGTRSASALYGNVATLALPLFLLCCAVIYVIGPPLISIIGSNYSADAISMTRNLLFVVAPITFFTGMRLLLSSLLNAEERFALVAIIPSFTAVAIILLVMLYSDSMGAYALAVGTVIGATLELALLFGLCSWRRISIRPRWSGFTVALRRVLRQFGPLAIGSLLLTSNIIVDHAMAAALGPGSVSSLGFGSRITTVFVGLGTAILASAVFPYLSMMVAQRDWSGIRHTMRTYARLMAYVTIPVTALLLIYSDKTISVIFERGQFNAEDTKLVGSIQFYYALQIPFHVIAILASRLISALQRNKILMWGTIISLALNITLNLIFMKFMGVAGIALSTACVHVVSFTYLWVMLYYLMPKADGVAEDE